MSFDIRQLARPSRRRTTAASAAPRVLSKLSNERYTKAADQKRLAEGVAYLVARTNDEHKIGKPVTRLPMIAPTR